MSRTLDHIYIVGTIVFTVYSQLVMRWQVALAGELPDDLIGKIHFVVQLFLNPWIISSIFATLLAGVSWMLAMSRFDISYAYPWIGINFFLMLFFGVLLFDESFGLGKIAGTFLIVAGIIAIARS
jgi:multidrug transporter EmrE-like cation transporter